MHELSIVEGIIRSIEFQKKTHDFSRVTAVEIVCGKYNCLSEENLQFCFDIAAKSTYMEGAKLRVTRSGDKYRCLRCGAEFNAPSGRSLACPSCGAREVTLEIDHSVYIRNLEVE